MKGTIELYDLMLIIRNFELTIKELEAEVIESALLRLQDYAGGCLRVQVAMPRIASRLLAHDSGNIFVLKTQVTTRRRLTT